MASNSGPDVRGFAIEKATRHEEMRVFDSLPKALRTALSHAAVDFSAKDVLRAKKSGGVAFARRSFIYSDKIARAELRAEQEALAAKGRA